MSTAIYSIYEQAFRAAQRNTSWFDWCLQTFQQYQASIVSGILSLNVSANVYPIYRMLTK